MLATCKWSWGRKASLLLDFSQSVCCKATWWTKTEQIFIFGCSRQNLQKKTNPITLDFWLIMLTSHPFPVIRWQISDLVLWDEILQDLGDVLEVRLVIFKFNPVDQCCQLVDLLSWTFVVASQILRQLLLGVMSSCKMYLSFQVV